MKLLNQESMDKKEIDMARADAIQLLIKWGKRGIAYFPMRDAVNRYMEVAGMNAMSIDGEDGIRAHRKIAAQGLEIECIASLTSEQLSKVDQELGYIANDIPRQQSRGMKL